MRIDTNAYQMLNPLIIFAYPIILHRNSVELKKD